MWRIVNMCEANAVQPSVDAEGTPEYAVWQVIGFVNTPQLVECLHSLQDTRDSILSVVHTCLQFQYSAGGGKGPPNFKIKVTLSYVVSPGQVRLQMTLSQKQNKTIK